MADAEIPLRVTLQKTDAAADAKKLADDLKAVNDRMAADAAATAAKEIEAAKKAAAEKARLTQDSATARERLARRSAEIEQGLNADTARSLKRAHTEVAESATAAFEKSGAAGSASMGSITSSMLPLAAGMGALIKLTHTYGDAVQSVGRQMDERAKKVQDQFDKLQRLGGLTDKAIGGKAVVANAELAARTRMTTDQAIKAQESFMDSGAQHIGGEGQISKATADKAFEKTARIAVAKHVDPEVVADLTGKALGMKGYAKFGDKAPEEIQRDINASLSILSSGSGKEDQLGGEVAKLAAASVSEEKTKGSLHTVKDASKLISVMTEGFPMGQAEAAQSMLRGVRGFDRKEGGFLQEAGVTPEDDYVAALGKIKLLSEAKAAAGPKGTTAEDIINKEFEDRLSARAISVGINKGIGGGLFARRDEVGAAAEAPGAAEKTIAKFDTSEAGVEAKNRAVRALVEARKGAALSKVSQLSDEAETRLVSKGTVDTPVMRAFEGTVKMVTGGIVDPRQMLRDKMIRDQLLKKMRPADRAKFAEDGGVPIDPGERADYLNKLVTTVEASGRSAIATGPADLETTADARRVGWKPGGGMDPGAIPTRAPLSAAVPMASDPMMTELLERIARATEAAARPASPGPVYLPPPVMVPAPKAITR